MSSVIVNFPESPIGKVPPNVLHSLSFVEDINKLYTGSKIILVDYLHTLYPEIKIGDKVEIFFYDGNNEYKSTMRILTVGKTTSDSGLVNLINITLISSWYFESTVETKAYSGNVSDIIQEVYSVYFKNKGINLDVIATGDAPRIRYQISEKPQDFMKRILKYGLSNNSPLYLYTDYKATLTLRSLSDFIFFTPIYSYVPEDSQILKEVSKTSITSQGTQPIRLISYSETCSIYNSSANHTSYFTSDAFISSTTVPTSVTLKNSENSNNKVIATSPSSIDYKDWSLTPQDALALSIKQYYDVNLPVFTLSGSLAGFNLLSARLGSLVKVFLPAFSKDKTKEVTSKGYVLQRIERIYRDNMETCNFNAFLARY